MADAGNETTLANAIKAAIDLSSIDSGAWSVDTVTITDYDSKSSQLIAGANEVELTVTVTFKKSGTAVSDATATGKIVKVSVAAQ